MKVILKRLKNNKVYLNGNESSIMRQATKYIIHSQPI